MEQQAVATSGAGSWLQTGNSFLNTALNAWAKVEEVKAARSSSGADVQGKTTQIDFANGAAVQVDKVAADMPKKPPFDYKNGAIWFGGLLALGLLLKHAGYK